MKVIAINGSPRKNSNTENAIKMVFAELESQGIETEIISIGTDTIRGCISCGGCYKTRNSKCSLDDRLNADIEKIKEADGIILGTPVYYAGMNGTLKAYLDRLFYVSGANGNFFRHKVGCSVVAVRREGGIQAFNELNEYLLYSEMFVPTSNYWNIIHGTQPEECKQDEEGKQIMSILGKNMAHLLKMNELSKEHLKAPEQVKKTFMNFIR